MKQQQQTGAGQQSKWIKTSAGLLGGVTLTWLALVTNALAESLTQWNFDQQSNRLVLTVKTNTPPRYFMMAQPARIVVDLPNTQLKNVDRQQTYGGAVRQIRVSQFKPDQARIVIELSPDAVLAPGQVRVERSGQQWVVRPLIVESKGEAIATQRTIPPSEPVTPAAALPSELPPDNSQSVLILPPPAEIPPSSTEATVLPPPPVLPPEMPGSSGSPLPTPAPNTTASQSPEPVVLPPASFAPSTAGSQVSVPPLAQPATVARSEPMPTTPFILLPSSTPTTPLSLPAAAPIGQPSEPAETEPLATAATLNLQPQSIQTQLPPAQPQAIAVPPVQPQTVSVPPLAPANTTAQVPASQPPAPQPAPQPAIAIIQPDLSARPGGTPVPAVRIPILEFGQPLPKTGIELPPPANNQLAPQLPPLEPGAIVLPVEGPNRP